MANENQCPAENLLKMLAGRWRPQIFRLTVHGPVRFNTLLRQLEGSNKQSVAVALKELEEYGLLERNIIRPKPLHVEYKLSAYGRSLVPLLYQLEGLSGETHASQVS